MQLISCFSFELLRKALLEKINRPGKEAKKLRKIGRTAKAYRQNPKQYFEVLIVNEKIRYATKMKEKTLSGTVCGIYSGELRFEPFPLKPCNTPELLAESAYDMSLEDRIRLGDKDYQVLIQANYYGDLTCFAPHLPCTYDLIKRTPVAKGISKWNIPSNNIKFSPGIDDEGNPVVIFQATRRINKDEFGGICYGFEHRFLGYWARGIIPDRLLKEKGGVRVLTYDDKEQVYKKTSDFVPHKPMEKTAKLPTYEKQSIMKSACSALIQFNLFPVPTIIYPPDLIQRCTEIPRPK